MKWGIVCSLRRWAKGSTCTQLHAERQVPRLEPLEARQFLSAQTPAALASPIDPGNLISLGKVALFVAGPANRAAQLWRTDGTAAGTYQLLTLKATRDESFIFAPQIVGQSAYFAHTAKATGQELWTTDGTLAGTRLVKDINRGKASSNITFLPSLGNTLLFQADDGIHGKELWRTDGTDAGTFLARDILRGSGSPEIAGYTVAGKYLYFTTIRAIKRDEEGRFRTMHNLWRTDGTSEGTFFLHRMSEVHTLTNLNGTLILREHKCGMIMSLWRSNGTVKGTVAYATLDSAYRDPPNFETISMMEDERLLVLGGKAFLQMKDPEADAGFSQIDYEPIHHPASLYVTDGTKATALTCQDPLDPSKPIRCFSDPVVAGGTFYFTVRYGADDAAYWAGQRQDSTALWKSDGTPQGTVLVKRFPRGTLTSMLNLGGSVCMRTWHLAADGMSFSGPFELWTTDGTEAGTVKVSDYPETLQSPVAIGRYSIYLNSKEDGKAWVSEKPPTGYAMFTDPHPDPGWSLAGSISSYTFLGNRFIFVTNDGIHGNEIWTWNYIRKRPPQPVISRSSDS
jgi:ELWxxDGT repeat protein